MWVWESRFLGLPRQPRRIHVVPLKWDFPLCIWHESHYLFSPGKFCAKYTFATFPYFFFQQGETFPCYLCQIIQEKSVNWSHLSWNALQGHIVYTSERNCNRGIWSGLQGEGVSSFPSPPPYTYGALVRRCTEHACIRFAYVTGRTIVNRFSEYFLYVCYW